MSPIQQLITQTLIEDHLPSWSAKPTPLGYLLKKRKLPEYETFDFFYRGLSAKNQNILRDPLWNILSIVAEQACRDAQNNSPKPTSVAAVMNKATYYAPPYDTFKRAFAAVKFDLSDKKQKPFYFKTWGLLQATYDFAGDCVASVGPL